MCKNRLQFVNASSESITENQEVSYKYRLSCEEYWHGFNCETYCRERDDEIGHDICNYIGVDGQVIIATSVIGFY